MSMLVFDLDLAWEYLYSDEGHQFGLDLSLERWDRAYADSVSIFVKTN